MPAIPSRRSPSPIAWRRAGVPSPHGVASVAAPAVSGNVVVYPLANRSLIGTGRISVTVRISRFFKVRFSTGVTYTFAKGGGKSALSKSEARAKLARAV